MLVTLAALGTLVPRTCVFDVAALGIVAASTCVVADVTLCDDVAAGTAVPRTCVRAAAPAATELEVRMYLAAACGAASVAGVLGCALSDRAFARAAVAELPAERDSAPRREVEEAPPASAGIVVAASRARTDAPPTAGAGMLVLALAARRVRQYAEESLTVLGVREVSLGGQPAEFERRPARAAATCERTLERLRPYIGACEITCELQCGPPSCDNTSLRG